MHGIDARKKNADSWSHPIKSQAWQSFASAAGGAPSKCSEAAFVCGLVASLAAPPDLVGQSGGVERVEREDHESAIHLCESIFLVLVGDLGSPCLTIIRNGRWCGCVAAPHKKPRIPSCSPMNGLSSTLGSVREEQTSSRGGSGKNK